MLRRLIFISPAPVSDFDCKRLGIEGFASLGFEAALWDVSGIFYRHLKPPSSESPAESSFIVRLSSMRAFASQCEHLAHADAAVFLGILGDGSVLRWRKLLSLMQAQVGVTAAIGYGALPSVGRFLPTAHSTRSFRRVGYRLRRLRSSKAMRRGAVAILVERVIMRTGRVRRLVWKCKPLDIVWLGSLAEPRSGITVGPSTEVRYVHSLDYDLLLQMHEESIASDACVVVVPGGHDGDVLGIQGTLSWAEYEALICQYLDTLEGRFGTRFLVAAHPRHQKEQSASTWGGREVHLGQTANLIRDARLVFMPYFSTAASWAAVFNKPMVGLADPRLGMLAIAEAGMLNMELGVPLLGAPADALDLDDPIINRRRYQNYVENYVKSPESRDVPLRESIAQDLLSLLNQFEMKPVDDSP